MYGDKTFYYIQNGKVIESEPIITEYSNGDVRTESGLKEVSKMYEFGCYEFNGYNICYMVGADIDKVTQAWNNALENMKIQHDR